MSPTAELRFVMRPVLRAALFGLMVLGTERVLQQKWVQHHIPAGQTSAPSEWRDVPLVVEVRNG